tara:strand:+ start:2638 stop:3060 length:423 start_codon:yes stop_codon:yes gene_type:complete
MKELIGDECFNILDNKEYIFFYFGASWCKPCQEILPSLELLINEFDEKKIRFYKIDIDNKENRLICNKCNIKAVPSFLLFKDRIFLSRTKGNDIDNIKQMIIKELFPNLPFFKKEETLQKIRKLSPFIKNKELFNKKNIN